MEYLIEEPVTFKVRLTIEEIKLIKDLTQHCPHNFSDKEKEAYSALFIGMSNILGIKSNSNGTTNKILEKRRRAL